MRAKVPKSRVLAIRQGKVIDNPQLSLNSLPIPPVDEPIKFLSMPLSSTLDNAYHRQPLVCKLIIHLTQIEAQTFQTCSLSQAETFPRRGALDVDGLFQQQFLRPLGLVSH